MKQERTYHLGLLRGTGKTRYWSNGHSTSTLILQARKNVDSLSPDLWYYIGERIITKKQLKINAIKILEQININNHTSFNKIIID
jgi:hypothetical protein